VFSEGRVDLDGDEGSDEGSDKGKKV